jgi:hypothetical protein
MVLIFQFERPDVEAFEQGQAVGAGAQANFAGGTGSLLSVATKSCLPSKNIVRRSSLAATPRDLSGTALPLNGGKFV